MKKNSLEHHEISILPQKKQLFIVLKEIQKHIIGTRGIISHEELRKILCKYPDINNALFKRSHLIAAYRHFVASKEMKPDEKLLSAIQMKPMRTQSGVAPVTVLTKPFPCPGRCIFCPSDTRMPKSYLSDEPGAQRAARNSFDPYLQTYNRLLAFHNIGHGVEKVELIVLGGTWSHYPEKYQIWFIKRCFDAMNDFPKHDRRSGVKAGKTPKATKNIGKKNYNVRVSDWAQKHGGFFEKHEAATWEELENSHRINETAFSRNVGLVVETRPDRITPTEVIRLRRLGCTKIQIGIQHTSNSVLARNKRGHTQKETKNAIAMLRLAGFKIHAHWMANLFGSTVAKDIESYKKLWGPNYSPDELKIYPTSIIKSAELYKIFREGGYRPYTHDELLRVLTNTMPETPRYARLTRVIRDFPSTNIIAGNKLSNFRQIAEKEIIESGKKLRDIRSREIKNREISMNDLRLEKIIYRTSTSDEYFLSYATKKDDKIAGFLRLSIPNKALSKKHFIPELENAAIIREVHVYGTVVGIGKKSSGLAQHLGLGSLLTELSCKIAKKHGYKKLAVISAVGTREYYRKRRFIDSGMYLVREI